MTLTKGAQSRAVVLLRSSSVTDSVSCQKSGCWAVGRPVHGTGAYLVKISSAGRLVAAECEAAGTVPLPQYASRTDCCKVCQTGHGARPSMTVPAMASAASPCAEAVS